MEGEIKVSKFFNNKSALKVLSIVVALFIWVFVLNTSNPYETTTFKGIPLKVQNEDFLAENDYVLKNNYKTSIDITIRGRHDSINKVKDSDFEASIDFSTIEGAADTYLAINGPFCSAKDISIISYNPENIEIMLSRITSKSFPLELSSNITVKSGYKVISVAPNVDSLTLNGEEALINSVDRVVASIDIKDLDKDVNKVVECKALNNEGKEIAILSRNLTAEVSVKVAKAVAVSLVANGSINDNYTEVSRTVTPNVVYIIGTTSVLAKVTDLKTEPVSIKDLTANLTTKVPLVLPEGVKLAEIGNEVDVNIIVEQILNNTFEIVGGDIILLNKLTDGSVEYRIKTEKVSIQLKGRKSLLDDISSASLHPTVDVSNLSEGTHRIPLKLSLPSLVKITQDGFIEVEVVKVTPESPI